MVTGLHSIVTVDRGNEEVFAAPSVLLRRNKAPLLPRCPSAMFPRVQVRFLWAITAPGPDNTAL